MFIFLIVLLPLTDLHPKGGLLTLFLHSPLTAVCVLGQIAEIPYHLWETGQAFVDRFLAEASRLLTRAKGLGNSFSSLVPCKKVFAFVTPPSQVSQPVNCVFFFFFFCPERHVGRGRILT